MVAVGARNKKLCGTARGPVNVEGMGLMVGQPGPTSVSHHDGWSYLIILDHPVIIQ